MLSNRSRVIVLNRFVNKQWPKLDRNLINNNYFNCSSLEISKSHCLFDNQLVNNHQTYRSLCTTSETLIAKQNVCSDDLNSKTSKTGLQSSLENCCHFTCSREQVQPILSSLQLYEYFISETEEAELMQQIEKSLKKRRYEDSHWDYVS